MNGVTSGVPTQGTPLPAAGVQNLSLFEGFINNLPKWVMIAASVVAVAGIAFTLYVQSYVALIGFAILLPVSLLGIYFADSDSGSIAEIQQTANQLHMVNVALSTENARLKQESAQLAQTANLLQADNQHIQQTCHQLQGINQDFQARNADLQRTQQGMQTLINQMREQNAQLQAAVSQNEAAARRFQEQVALSKQQNQALAEENQRLQKANEELKANIAIIQSKVDELQGYIRQIEQETASLAKGQESFRKNLGMMTTTTAGMSSASAALASSSKKLTDATTNFDLLVNTDMQRLAVGVGEAQNTAQTILGILKDQNNTLTQDLSKITEALARMQALEQQTQASTRDLAALEAKKRELLVSLQSISDDVVLKQTSLRDTLAKIAAEETSLAATTAKYQTTVQEVAANEQKLRALATAIEQASDLLAKKIAEYKALHGVPSS